MQRWWTGSWLVAAVALVVLVSGCGSDTTSSSATTAADASTSSVTSQPGGGVSSTTTTASSTTSKVSSSTTSSSTTVAASTSTGGGIDKLCANHSTALDAPLGETVTVSTDKSHIESMGSAYRRMSPTAAVRGCDFASTAPRGLNGSVIVITPGGGALYDALAAAATGPHAAQPVSIGDAGMATSTSVSANVFAHRGDVCVQVTLANPYAAIPGAAGEQPNPAFQAKAEAVAKAALG